MIIYPRFHQPMVINAQNKKNWITNIYSWKAEKDKKGFLPELFDWDQPTWS